MAIEKLEGLDWFIKEQANEALIKAAVDSGNGLVSYATNNEAITGTSTILSINPANLQAVLQGDVKTITDATPATFRLIRSELTVTPSSSVAVDSNGSLAAVRGCTTLTTGKSITDGYLYGVQGKVVLDGATVVIGSDHVAGIYAQLSGSSTTVTSGHVAIMIASGQNLPTSANVDGLYLESGGGKINSVIKSNVKATYFLDISDFESAGICSDTGTVETEAGWIKVLVDGSPGYIQVFSAIA
jgi:hypothetical protein